MQLMPSPMNKTMRQGQQHRRGGGRGPRPQNGLARNYESNGPNVKLRGTAAQIAEKYLSLARDALVSGDMVAAESYFQHAEHYNRIIMATQSQMGVPNSHPSAGHGFRPRWNAEVSDRFGNRPGERMGPEHIRPEKDNGNVDHDAHDSNQPDSPKRSIKRD
jgi:hypothetical protein